MEHAFKSKKTIDETNRRREKQLHYNEEHHIIPRQIQKARTMGNLIQIQQETGETRAYVETEDRMYSVADPIVQMMSREQLEKSIETTRKRMQEAAKKLDFIEAAALRDEMLRMQAMLDKRSAE